MIHPPPTPYAGMHFTTESDFCPTPSYYAANLHKKRPLLARLLADPATRGVNPYRVLLDVAEVASVRR